MNIAGGEKSPLGNLLQSGDVGKAAQMAYAVLSLVDKSDGDKKSVISRLNVICIFSFLLQQHQETLRCCLHTAHARQRSDLLAVISPPTLHTHARRVFDKRNEFLGKIIMKRPPGACKSVLYVDVSCKQILQTNVEK